MKIKCTIILGIVYQLCGIYEIATLNTDSIFFRVFTGKSFNDSIDVPITKANDLMKYMCPERSTVLYIHGFTENVEKESVKTIVDAYLQIGDFNIIAVDYGVLAGQNYLILAINSQEVGVTLASVLNKLVKSGLKSETLHVIGHSLGGQIAGAVGRNMDTKLSHITGLDPAGPLYHIVEPHLSSSDAEFVDILHTDAGKYGITIPTGHVDIYPNGGIRIQPGCPINPTFYSDEDFCSHRRAWKYYAESLIMHSLVATKCSSYIAFKGGKCNENEKTIVAHVTPNTTHGRYYLNTNDQKPFGRGIDGAQVEN